MTNHNFSAFAFGIMDGVINVLGILLGVYGATENKLAVVSAVIAGAIANGVANASGIHVAKEVEGVKGHDKIAIIMAHAFLATLFAGIVAILPLFFLSLKSGVILGMVLGLALLFLLGLFAEGKASVAVEYTALGLAASVIAFFLGKLINVVV